MVRFGARFGLSLYVLTGVLGSVLACIVTGLLSSPWGALQIVYLLFHFSTFKKMKRLDGRALNPLIGETSRNIILFGVVTCASLLLAR